MIINVLLAVVLLAGLMINGSIPALANASSGTTPTAEPSASASTEAPAETPDPTADTTVEESAAAVYPDRYLTLLKDHGYTVESVDGQQVPKFVTCSNQYDAKEWTDSICPKLDPKDRNSVIARILGSPDYAAMVGSGLSRMEITQLDGSKITLAEINPWLNEFSDPATINDWSQSAMEATGADRVAAAKKMVLVAILAERFSDGGVQGDRTTAFNYRLADGKDGSLAVDPENPNGAIPEFALSPKQYKGEFIVFRVTYKGFTGCFAEFGINTGDGRFAGFTCERPKPEKPTPPPPPTTPPTTPPTNPPPPPSCEETGTCPPPPPECVKPDKPGSGYTWDQKACKWNPPKPPECVKGDKPGNGYTWNQEKCKWEPPKPPVCVKPDKPGDGWTWNQDQCKWNPPKPPECVKTDPPGPAGDYTWDQEKCKWIKIDKPSTDNPPPPPGVKPAPEVTEPPEEVPPPPPAKPVQPSEKPGDPIPPADNGKPDVPADNDEELPPPPAPPVEDEDVPPPSPEDEGTEIKDPDAAAIAPIGLLPLAAGLFWRRRKARK
jgi:hypothetical protein